MEVVIGFSKNRKPIPFKSHDKRVLTILMDRKKFK